MKRKFLIPASLALAAAAAALFGACKATDMAGNATADAAASRPPAQAAPASGTTVVNADGARRVTPAELQKMLEDGRAVVYDTRSKASYDQEHIKGSFSMPSNEVESRVGELPKGKTLVFYCT